MLAESQVLVLPLDVSNSRSSGGMRIDIFWQIIYILVMIMLVLVLPWTLFYYESENTETGKKSCCYAIKYVICLVIIVALILGITYAFLSYVNSISDLGGLTCLKYLLFITSQRIQYCLLNRL